jgi:hypothetical protein
MGKWAKGESGNPGGRPKVLAEFRELARQHAPAAIKELARLAVKAKSETARVAAIRELLDRGYGKASQLIPSYDDVLADRYTDQGGKIVIEFVEPPAEMIEADPAPQGNLPPKKSGIAGNSQRAPS